MRVFKDKRFSRFAKKEKISDAELLGIVSQVDAGNAEADLGGGVYKVRVPRDGEGKSGGYRVILLFKKDRVTFFEQGYAKSDLANISRTKLVWLKQRARDLFPLDDTVLDKLVKSKAYKEIGGSNAVQKV
jgi:hypothetical protein